MTKIICFNGPPGSGKDTGADYIEKKFNATKITIANPVKRLVSSVYKVLIDELEDNKDHPLEKLKGKTPRDCYKFWGEKVKELHGDSHWIDVAIADIKVMEKLDPFPLYVISDLGFQVEFNRLIEEFGEDSIKLLRIARDGCDFWNDTRGYVYSHHSSGERYIPNASIANNGTIAEYKDKLKSVVKEWLCSG